MNKEERLKVIAQSQHVVELESEVQALRELVDELLTDKEALLQDIHSIWMDELDPLQVVVKWEALDDKYSSVH